MVLNKTYMQIQSIQAYKDTVQLYANMLHHFYTHIFVHIPYHTFPFHNLVNIDRPAYFSYNHLEKSFLYYSCCCNSLWLPYRNIP